MSLAPTVSSYLSKHHIHYQVLGHPYSESSLETASRANIKPEQLVKALVLENSAGELAMILTSASKKIHPKTLNQQLRKPYSFVPEFELADLFKDCVEGAIPAVGQAYGLETFVDFELLTQPDLYIEAGDHKELVHFTGSQFHFLMKHSKLLIDL